MKFVHIHDMDADKSKVAKVKADIQAGKHVFMLIYMQGCGPCNATRPEWAKIEAEAKKHTGLADDIVIVDVDKDCVPALSGVIEADSIAGFPTLRYINGAFTENYENSSVESKDRTTNSFIEWIKIKAEGARESAASRRFSMGGGYRKTGRHRRTVRKIRRRKSRRAKSRR
jgi:thiol-disulfide isomerase/thioredoxin